VKTYIAILLLLCPALIAADATAPTMTEADAEHKATLVIGTDWSTYPSSPDTRDMTFPDGTQMHFKYINGWWGLRSWTIRVPDIVGYGAHYEQHFVPGTSP